MRTKRLHFIFRDSVRGRSDAKKGEEEGGSSLGHGGFLVPKTVLRKFQRNSGSAEMPGVKPSPNYLLTR